MVECKDVVSKPDVLHPICFFQFTYLRCDGPGRANLELISGDWLSAPVAAIGAPTAGDNIRGEVAVRRSPSPTVGLEIDEFACGFGKGVPGCVLRSPVCALNKDARCIEVDEAWDIQVGMSGQDRDTKFDERLFGLTTKDKSTPLRR